MTKSLGGRENPTKPHHVDLDCTPKIRATKLKNPTGVELMALIIEELKTVCTWDPYPGGSGAPRYPRHEAILNLSESLRNIVEITASDEQLWVKTNRENPDANS